MIRSNPQLDAWVRIAPDGTVTVMTGRVELGQGMLTVMRQVAADELDVAPERLVLISGDTAQTPNEGHTAGSLAVKLGSTALGLACADARATLVAVAAQAWNVQPAAIKVEDGQMLGPAGQRMSYGEAAGKVSLSRPVDVTAKRKSPAEQKIIGTSYPRVDIPAKVFGQQVFIHDLRPAGMLFGAVARPPAYAARLVSADLAAIRAMPGVVEVVRDGSFLGVVARREEQAQAAANTLAKSAKWDAGAPLFGGKKRLRLPADGGVGDGGAAHREGRCPARRHDPQGGVPPPLPGPRLDRRQLRAGRSGRTAGSPSGRTRQGPFPLRADLAKALKVAPDTIRVIHAQGAGCYGHNGADDVALDAALLARAVPGRPVRVHWAHEEEMAWEPWGSAMVTRLTGGVSADGALTLDARCVVVPAFDAAGQRRGLQPALRLVSRRSGAADKAMDIPLPTGGAARNAVPIYAAANQTVTSHFLAAHPDPHLGAADAGRLLQCRLGRDVHRRAGRHERARSGRLPARQRQGPAARGRPEEGRGDVGLDAGRRDQAAAGAGDDGHRRRALALQEQRRLCGGGGRGVGQHHQRRGPGPQAVERDRYRARRQPRRRPQPDRRRHLAGRELDPAGGRPLGPRHHDGGRLQHLSDRRFRHDADHAFGGDRPTRPAFARCRRGQPGAGGSSDRQRRLRGDRPARCGDTVHAGARARGPPRLTAPFEYATIDKRRARSRVSFGADQSMSALCQQRRGRRWEEPGFQQIPARTGTSADDLWGIRRC